MPPLRDERFIRMRPPLKNFGGHPEFHQYRTWFRSLYRVPNKQIFDVIRRQVLFGQYPPFEDAAHVCYGGPKENVGKVEEWKEERAERIAWIELAITSPNFIVTGNTPNGQVYLLYLGPDPGTVQEPEYYCVVVNAYESRLNEVEFVTAYDVTYTEYDRMRKYGSQIYPKPTPRRRKKKKT